MRSFSLFEEALQRADTWERRIETCLDGILNNLFYRGAWLISKLNLATLEVRYPELYETVRNIKVRKALILSGMFKAKPFSSVLVERFGEEALEVEIDEEAAGSVQATRDFFLMLGLEEETNINELYGGGDAVKVFLKSAFILSGEIRGVLTPVLMDPWRAKEGLEDKAEKLRQVMINFLENDVKSPPKYFWRPERNAGRISYYLYYWQGASFKKRLEKLLGVKLSL